MTEFRIAGSPRRLLTVTMLALTFLLIVTGLAVTGPATSAHRAAAQPNGDWQFVQSDNVNQWWLQVTVTPPLGTSVSKVEAIVDGSTWHTLTRQSYGDWTVNVNVGADPLILYRAWDMQGQKHDSATFDLAGTTQDSSPDESTTSAPISSPSSTPPPTTYETASSGREQILTGDYASYVWVSDQFAGSWTRKVAGDHDRYLVTLNQTAGGLDTDIVRHDHPVQRVDELSADLTVSATTDVRLQTQGDGMWWAGPKFTVHDETSFQGFSGDYENYIIENASLSPDAFAERMFKNSTYLGETQVDGATYKHYLSTLRAGWEQYWAVRQQYRTAGEVSVSPHLQKWRDSGMANDFVLIQKPANIETYGAVTGEIEISSPTYTP